MNKWYTNLKKAPWSPPSYIFGIVWPILYAMMAVSFFLVWNNQNCFPLLFSINYILNTISI